MEDDILDPAFVPMFEHVSALTCVETGMFEDESTGYKLELDEIITEMPIEMDVHVDENGKVILGTTPPVYYVNTSLLPVYHNIKIRIKGEKIKNNGNTEQTLEP